jgi:hypothetical protein
VTADLPVVRAAAEAHGRRKRTSSGELVTWWEFYVETGLGRRTPLSVVDISSHVDGVEVADDRQADAEARLVDEQLIAALAHAALDTDPARVTDTVARSLQALARQGVLPDQVLRRVLDDRGRLAAIARAATDVAQGLVRVA